MTEEELLEQEYGAVLNGKTCSILYTDYKGVEHLTYTKVFNVAINLTNNNDKLILFTSHNLRLELSLDDFSTHIKILN